MRIYLIFVIEFIKKYWIFLFFILFLSGVLAFFVQKIWRPKTLASVQILLNASYLNPNCLCVLENHKQILKSPFFWQKIFEKSSKQYQFFVKKNQLWQEIPADQFPFQIYLNTHSQNQKTKFMFFKIDVNKSEFLWYLSAQDKNNIDKIPFRSATFKTHNIQTKNHHLIIQPKTNTHLNSGDFKIIWQPFEEIFPDVLKHFSLEQINNTSILRLSYLDQDPQKARQILRFVLEEFTLFLQNSSEDKAFDYKKKINSMVWPKAYFSFIEPIQLQKTSLVFQIWFILFLIFLGFLLFSTRKKIYFTKLSWFSWLNSKSTCFYLYFSEPKTLDHLHLFSKKTGFFLEQKNNITEDFSDFSSLIYTDTNLMFESFSENANDFFIFLYFAQQKAKKGKKILLIDLHWKNPQFVKYFACSFQNSLRDYCVIENLPLFYLPIPYSANIDLIFCEQWTPEACHFEKLLTWAKQHYEQIIFYAPFLSDFSELSSTKVQLFVKNQWPIINYLTHSKNLKKQTKTTTFWILYHSKKAI